MNATPAGTPVHAGGKTEASNPEPHLMDMLSDEERQCLGNPASAEEILANLDVTSHGVHTGAMACLNEENQFRLYAAHAKQNPEIQGLPADVHRCIWETTKDVAALQEFQTDAADPHAAMIAFGKSMLIDIMMPVHCVSNSTAEQDLLSDADLKELEHLTCSIEQAGGYREWAKLIITDDGAFERVTSGNEPGCPANGG